MSACADQRGNALVLSLTFFLLAGGNTHTPAFLFVCIYRHIHSVAENIFIKYDEDDILPSGLHLYYFVYKGDKSLQQSSSRSMTQNENRAFCNLLLISSLFQQGLSVGCCNLWRV